MVLFRLLLVLGVCLPCRGIVEQDAVTAVRALGARVTPLFAGGEAWEVDFHVGGQDCGDQDLGRLAALTPIGRLNLGGTRVTDEGLAALSALTDLVHLDLSRTAIQGPGLAHLAVLRDLEYLNLYGTQVDDAALQHLAVLPSLKKVFLWQTRVTPEGAGQLLVANPDLQVNLGVGVKVTAPVPMHEFTAERTAAARALLAEAGAPVRVLAQDGPVCLVDFHWKPAAVTPETLAALIEIPDLVEVHLGGTPVADADLALLGRVVSLEVLHLDRTQVGDAGLAYLSRLRKLRTLNLHSTGITDAGLEVLAALPSLARLFVWNTAVTAEAAERLQASRRGLIVQHGWDDDGPEGK